MESRRTHPRTCLYFKLQGLSSSQQRTLIEELSALLIERGRMSGAFQTSTFRNANGVNLKMMNFRRLDPTFIKAGRKGMERGGKAEIEIWNEFVGDRIRLSKIAADLRHVTKVALTQQSEDDDAYEGSEGSVILATHRRYERDRKLIRKKRDQAKKAGPLKCEACSFEFAQKYGKIAADFIEVHHLKPVHLMKEGEKTKLSDLALLCSNCHRVAHLKSPPLSLADIRALLNI